jgi:hypothetical protein
VEGSRLCEGDADGDDGFGVALGVRDVDGVAAAVDRDGVGVGVVLVGVGDGVLTAGVGVGAPAGSGVGRTNA